ncbi:MAG: type II toxin-antitoxin system VapB family antitoxin [Ilumatobacteraceae bacterium]|nr:type II toxin-antitoxin system VapB family antitoxin [Ilumatobacteraceae bacterium]
MRTTVNIDDALLAIARRRAAERGWTVSEVIDAALRREFAERATPRAAPAIVVFTGGTGPAPGVDVTSNAAMLDALDDGVEPDHRR